MSAFSVVLDTNVFISTFILHGRSTLLAQRLFDGRFTLLVSEPILEEYFEVATRPRFRTTRHEIKVLMERMSPWMHFLRHPKPLKISAFPDPTDQKFVECAVAGKAGYLVTGDHALLHLKRYRGVSVVSIASFLKTLGMSL